MKKGDEKKGRRYQNKEARERERERNHFCCAPQGSCDSGSFSPKCKWTAEQKQRHRSHRMARVKSKPPAGAPKDSGLFELPVERSINLLANPLSQGQTTETLCSLSLLLRESVHHGFYFCFSPSTSSSSSLPFNKRLNQYLVPNQQASAHHHGTTPRIAWREKLPTKVRQTIPNHMARTTVKGDRT